MSARRRELLVVLALAGLAVAVWALVRTYPNYDSSYHLAWGREILDGHKPGFDAYQAPTEHPLYLAICTLFAALFGESADRALVLLGVLAFVGLLWAVFRTGRTVFGTWPAVVAALLVGSSFALLLYVARAYVDVPFLALVLWAAAIEAARPRRGLPVMALLTVAGLLRPEAWVLAGLYWLWLVAPAVRERGLRGVGRGHVGLAALALVAPVVWCLTDLWATGDPFWSLHATSGLAEELGRERGVGHVPGSFVRFLSDALRPPVFLIALGGLGLALWRREARALHVPLGLLAAGTLTFILTGLAGLSILPRYLTVPAIALALFAGYALVGWAALPAAERLRRPWAIAFAVCVVGGLGFVAARRSVIDRFTTELRYIRSTHDDLRALLRTPQVAAGRRCGPVSLPNYRLVPDTRWLLDADGEQVVARSDRGAPAAGVALVFTGEKTAKRFGRAAGVRQVTNVPPAGFTMAARVGPMVAYVSCPAA
ncbi:unannotated protein [freshwater metagenome]|uniref:Unannotated protein n=1 Tax=freshwater metagenome TaxID=449393 RepID=A0A6J7HCF9_9ZZZZ|nr:hypothetical protein [Actinomycetota bacterium]